MAEITIAYIGLGSNLGDRQSAITGAVKLLNNTEDTEVIRLSELIETAPLGRMSQPKYINAVAEIKTSLTAEDLHKHLLHIETSLGRQRNEKWSSRIIDLDILLFGNHIINRPRLTVPHPQMHLRSFVLKGLCRLNPNLLHPAIQESVAELAARLNGCDFVINPDLPQLISVAGIIGVGKTTLTEKLSDLLGAEPIFEAYDKNPYLSDVYAGEKELSLDSQLYFLTSRTTQLNRSTLAKGRIIISDYVFDKELIYAERLLNAKQLALYEQIYPPFAEVAAAPVLVIYLTDSPQNCLNRIHRRNRPYEQKIELQFLEDLHCDYKQLFADWKTSPLIRLSMSEFDYMQEANIQHLANQIKSYVSAPSIIASAAKQSKTIASAKR
jgi:2-amino-4-hydroxy-6-hydroxymethyldihydropteridine diphosphokinase